MTYICIGFSVRNHIVFYVINVVCHSNTCFSKVTHFYEKALKTDIVENVHARFQVHKFEVITVFISYIVEFRLLGR